MEAFKRPGDLKEVEQNLVPKAGIEPPSPRKKERI